MTQQDLLQAASQLNNDELKNFVAQLTAIYQERQSGEIVTETPILAIVHRSLPPQTQQRWDELLEKRDAESLTASEYAELLELTEEVEDFNVQRIEAISQLAQKRGVDLRTMMRQLNLPEPVYG